MEGFSSYHNNGNVREYDFNRLNQTGSSIQKITQNVSSISRMVQHLGTSQDSREFRAQLDQIQQYTQQLVKDTSANIKELNTMPSGLTQAEQKHYKMQKERLTDEFTTALNAFQGIQRTVAQKVKEQIQRSRALAMGDPFAPANKRDQLIELQDNAQRLQQDQLQEEYNLQQLEEQERCIRRLENDISDVNKIFKELGTLVHEQGDLVDSIEASVERTEVFVHHGTDELRQASTYRNKVIKKKFILALIAALILAVIISIIAWQLSN